MWYIIGSMLVIVLTMAIMTLEIMTWDDPRCIPYPDGRWSIDD